MRAFIKNYFDVSPSEKAKLRNQLVSHPVVQAQARENKISPIRCVTEAFDLWAQGKLVPVHDDKGKIIGFRPTEAMN